MTRQPLIRSFLFTFLFSFSPNAQATITVPDDRKQYASEPAAFGMFFNEGREYLARLQSLEDADPFLCDWDNIDENAKRIVVPSDGLPVALLAEKGQCTFEEKARLAQDLHPAIKYLIVYDDHPGEEILIQMSAEDPYGIGLGLLFTTFDSGQDLLFRITEQTDNQAKEGLRIYMDSYTPWGAWANFSYITWIVLGVTFGAITVYLCEDSDYSLSMQDTNLRVIVVDGNRQLEELLTEEEVMKLPEVCYRYEGEEGSFYEELRLLDAEDNAPMAFEHYNACSICLEEFESGEKLRLLPKCHHYFHSDCIIPWLTERNPTCPLCKANIKVDLMEEEEENVFDDDKDNDERRKCCCFSRYCGRRRNSNNEEEVEIEVENDANETLSLSSTPSLEAPLLDHQFDDLETF